jgi:hypothetical protein
MGKFWKEIIPTGFVPNFGPQRGGRWCSLMGWANKRRGAIQLAEGSQVISSGSVLKGQREDMNEEHSGPILARNCVNTLRGEEMG